jgi:hypothetical protein
VTWRLDDGAVTAAAGGEAIPAPEDDPAIPLVRGQTVPGAPRVALPFPAGAPGIYRKDHAGTLRARRRFAVSARALFSAGYEVDGVAVRPTGPVYLLSKRSKK